MNVELLSYTGNPDDLAGLAAATCTRGHNRTKALNAAMESGHESVLEHVVFTFKINGVSRALLAQLTRHRIASFSVESQRYCDMSDMPVVTPETIADNAVVRREWLSLLERIECFYRFAVDQGIPKEDARYATPQGAVTNLIMTMNARELLHFFSLRCCNKAQWEIRDLADKLLDICRDLSPRIFLDAGPGCVRGMCPEAKPCGNPRHKTKCNTDYCEL